MVIVSGINVHKAIVTRKVDNPDTESVMCARHLRKPGYYFAHLILQKRSYEAFACALQAAVDENYVTEAILLTILI